MQIKYFLNYSINILYIYFNQEAHQTMSKSSFSLYDYCRKKMLSHAEVQIKQLLQKHLE